MKMKSFSLLMSIFLGMLLLFGIHTSASAQGRGRGAGGGGNPGRGVSMGNPGRGHDSIGVERGIATSSERSRGRADEGRSTASENSRGRSDEGLTRARHASDERRRENARDADRDLHKFQGIARKLNTTPEALRSQYAAALAANPDLKFGQFVAANVVASNLQSRHPNITTSAILEGLRSGRSLGQTLQDLGLSESEAKEAKRNAERQIKAHRQ